MTRAIVFLALALLAAPFPARAVTLDQGVVVFDHADALAGGVTPGDVPGYPVSITAPGSYRLASNLSVAGAGVNGIEVFAAEVTIDFAGFRMNGSGTASGGVASIGRATTVRNGTVRAFSGRGLDLRGVRPVVENMRIVEAAAGGVVVSTTSGDARIVGNTITGSNNGVQCSRSCFIADNNISRNTFNGISLFSAGSTVLGNVLSLNGANGLATTTGVSSAGNNAIISNASGAIVATSSGEIVTIEPNACSPQAC